jgi:phenylacetyl-CoA:acceptor oxidoreductase subunit 1
MVIDLRRCNGCGCCTVNCSQVNQLPPGLDWRQVPSAEVLHEPVPRRAFLSMSCMHCANPPCLDVCPTSATRQRPDGIVTIDAALCMGCGYCVVACPYHARKLVPELPSSTETRRWEDHGRINPDLSGICTKCDLCLPRLENGLREGLTPGVDAAATPVCVQTCLSHAIAFGDLDDPESNVSLLLQERSATTIHEELGTEPAVHYLAD